MENKKFYETLVLTGPFTYGIIILGCLQYLYDNNKLQIKYYIASSVGTIICYLLAIGYTPSEILLKVCSKNPKKFIFIGGEGINGYLLRHFLEDMTLQKYNRLFTFKDFFGFFGKSLHFSFISKTKLEMLSHSTYPEMSCIEAICLACKHQTRFHLRVDGAEKNKKIIKIGLENSFGLTKKKSILSEYFFSSGFRPNTIELKSFDSLFVNFDMNTIKKHDMFSTGYLQAVTVLQ